LREFTQASNPLSGENIWFAGKIRSACDADGGQRLLCFEADLVKYLRVTLVVALFVGTLEPAADATGRIDTDLLNVWRASKH
jgi:hypothetical protein